MVGKLYQNHCGGWNGKGKGQSLLNEKCVICHTRSKQKTTKCHLKNHGYIYMWLQKNLILENLSSPRSISITQDLCRRFEKSCPDFWLKSKTFLTFGKTYTSPQPILENNLVLLTLTAAVFSTLTTIFLTRDCT